MKNVFNILFACLLLTACSNKSDLDTNKNLLVTDTSKMYNSNILTDTGTVIHTTTLQNNAAYTTPNNETVIEPRPRVVRKEVVYENRTERRRGWSHSAKDAVIGGIGGSITGALVSKNHGKGAIIGGLLGAGSGYLFGHSKDKNEGR